MFRGRGENPTVGAERANAEVLEFNDPVLSDEQFDTGAVLQGMRITMQRGELRTTVERICPLVRALVANEFSDSPAPPEEHTDTVRQIFKIGEGFKYDGQLLEEAQYDAKLASSLGIVRVWNLVAVQYEEAAIVQNPVAQHTPQEQALELQRTEA